MTFHLDGSKIQISPHTTRATRGLGCLNHASQPSAHPPAPTPAQGLGTCWTSTIPAYTHCPPLSSNVISPERLFPGESYIQQLHHLSHPGPPGSIFIALCTPDILLFVYLVSVIPPRPQARGRSPDSLFSSHGQIPRGLEWYLAMLRTHPYLQDSRLHLWIPISHIFTWFFSKSNMVFPYRCLILTSSFAKSLAPAHPLCTSLPHPFPRIMA